MIIILALFLLFGLVDAAVTPRDVIDLAAREQAARDAVKAQKSANSAGVDRQRQINIAEDAAKKADQNALQDREDRKLVRADQARESEAIRAAQDRSETRQSITQILIVIVGALSGWAIAISARVEKNTNSLVAILVKKGREEGKAEGVAEEKARVKNE